MKLAVTLSMMAAALFAQDAQNVSILHNDGYWIRTIRGTMNVPVTARLRISTRGRVVLRGSNSGKTTYQLTQRVRARSEDEARQLLGAVKTMTRVLPDSAILMITPSGADSVLSELQVRTPRAISGATLETRLGDIEAYDLEGDLQADTTAGVIHCDRIQGSLTGRTGGGEIRLGKIGGSVRCLSGGGSIFIGAAGGGANCQTAGGEIVVEDAGGPVVLSTEGGNIAVDKAAASVEAHSAAGVIGVTNAGGAVFADTRGGSIQVGSARGVKCESAAGGIRVKTSSSPLHISTAVGNILAELLAGSLIDDASLVAGSGDVTVMIPPNLPLSVLARNDSGGDPRIVSDFAEFRNKTFGFARPAMTAEGAINGGGPILRINVAGGTIYLRRMK
jgi:DUF4097 and DUF4098 domain-containing protein YvlB